MFYWKMQLISHFSALESCQNHCFLWWHYKWWRWWWCSPGTTSLHLVDTVATVSYHDRIIGTAVWSGRSVQLRVLCVRHQYVVCPETFLIYIPLRSFSYSIFRLLLLLTTTVRIDFFFINTLSQEDHICHTELCGSRYWSVKSFLSESFLIFRRRNSLPFFFLKATK